MTVRTIDDIYESFIDAKERINEIYTQQNGVVDNNATLSGLNSTSKTAIWRLLLYVSSVCYWVHEYLWVQFNTEVDVKISKAIPMTAGWYVEQLKKFQYGDNLGFVDFAPAYDVVDYDKRIVVQAAVIESMLGVLLIKVAKADGEGLQPLTPLELSGVMAYVDDIKAAGTQVQVQSLNADKMKVQAAVYYNPANVLGEVQAAVESAIEKYLLYLPFNGQILCSKLTDVIQAVRGVEDVKLSGLFVEKEGVFVSISRQYVALAGYAEISENAQLFETLSYFPNV